MSDLDRARRAAIHEASHVVVAMAEGARDVTAGVALTEGDPPQNGDGWTHFDREVLAPDSRVRIALAGAAGETIFLRIPARFSASDIALAEGADEARMKDPSWVEARAAEADEMLRARWLEVFTVAGELMLRGSWRQDASA